MYELRSAAKPTATDARRWIGKRVDDIHGKPIGRLSDVVEDPATGEPVWMLVRYGPGGDACTLIPLGEASRANRRVWVSYSREFVRSGPWIHRHTPLSARTGAEFAHHYGLGPAPAAEPATSVRPRPRLEPRVLRRRFAAAVPAAVSARQLASQR